jgi:hypothetical protein
MILSDITRCTDANLCPSHPICERSEEPLPGGLVEYNNFWDDCGDEEKGRCYEFICVHCKSCKDFKELHGLTCEICGE